ncbi:hypothetical protein B0H12DRAFT_1311418 [Mycena haematopus]|nr:hypothetical protein B0H12DRAFT_1311418 [Mycena haematopus]
MLNEFCALPTDHRLQRLHQALWPVGPLQPALPRTVPHRLASYLKTCELPDDGESGDDGEGGDDGEDDGKPQGPPNYLKISDTVFEVFALRKGMAPSILLVRDEYLNFLADVEKDRGQPPKNVRYFLTAGIRRQRQDKRHRVTYFGPNGCEKPKDSSVQIDIAAGNKDFDRALRNSWVLVDVDSDKNWMPADWIDEAGVVVWTCSPDAKRMRTFTAQTGAHPWYMRPWSQREFDAFISLNPEGGVE